MSLYGVKATRRTDLEILLQQSGCFLSGGLCLLNMPQPRVFGNNLNFPRRRHGPHKLLYVALAYASVKGLQS